MPPPVMLPSIAPSPMSLTAIAAPAPKREHADSINFSPLGLLIGAYALGYEHLFPGGHGLILEGGYAASSGSGGSAYSMSGTVGYRWHWRGQQNSGFLGVNLSQGFGRGTGTIDDNGKMSSIGVDVTATTLTANVGKRWMIGDSVNVTLRIGAGYGRYAVHTDSMDPDAKAAEKVVNDLLTRIPVAVDGELSIGYVF